MEKKVINDAAAYIVSLAKLHKRNEEWAEKAVREAVNAVVEQQNVQVDVAAQGVDEVITPDAEGVTVASHHPDRQIRTGGGQASRDRRCASVDAVNTVGIHVIGEARRTSDSGDEDDVLALETHFRHEALDGGEDGVVAAAGTPANFLVGLEILRLHLYVGLGDQRKSGECISRHDDSSICSEISRMTSTNSEDLNGRPRTWL